MELMLLLQVFPLEMDGILLLIVSGSPKPLVNLAKYTLKNKSFIMAKEDLSHF